jgi:hypothetical protein
VGSTCQRWFLPHALSLSPSLCPVGPGCRHRLPSLARRFLYLPRGPTSSAHRAVPSVRPLPLAAAWDRPVSFAFPAPRHGPKRVHSRTHAEIPGHVARPRTPSSFLSTARTRTRSPVPFRASSLSLALCPRRSTSPETHARRAGHLCNALNLGVEFFLL